MTSLTGKLAVLATATVTALTGVLINTPVSQAALLGCDTSLVVTRTQTEGATGHGSLTLLMRNTGVRPCALRGYPGLDTLTATGRVVAHARRTLHGFAGGANAVRTITVPPNGFASATVEWLNFNPVTSGSCPASSSIATTPPNTTHTRRFPAPIAACDLQIHPTVAGTSGNDLYARAQQYWLDGASASSVELDYYWTKAGSYLSRRRDLFRPEILLLRQLIHLPLTGLTPAQIAQAQHDVAELDEFFATAGLYR